MLLLAFVFFIDLANAESTLYTEGLKPYSSILNVNSYYDLEDMGSLGKGQAPYVYPPRTLFGLLLHGSRHRRGIPSPCDTFVTRSIVPAALLTHSIDLASPVPELYGCVLTIPSSILSGCFVLLLVYDGCMFLFNSFPVASLFSFLPSCPYYSDTEAQC